jgi:hypothetical protein
MMSDPSRVPKGLQSLYEEIVALTDAICADRLGPEYQVIAQRMVAALCRKRPSPLASGQTRTWAAGVIYVLGRINFLTDRSTEPYMSTADLAAFFDVGQSTIQGKGKVIQQALKANRRSVEWMLPSIAADNPLVWMAQVNGLIVDLRHMPREVQEIAFAKGMIPFVPDDGE